NTQPGQPIPPSQALASIRTPPGLTASLFASEPQVQQPIAIATDPQGRLWVAENYTYGEAKVGFDLSLRDRIVILEDSDHDGLADRRTVFTDQLQRLSSIELGFNGVWVLAPPQLLFFPDKNHDDQPDSPPVVLLDGFDSGPVRHNLANGLRWGPDGWLYGRHGIQATSLVGPPNTPPNLRTPINCGIWRYHPTRKIFEVVASGTTTPWGLDWDHFGEAFFTNTVIGHLWHLIPGAHYDRMYGKDLTPHTYELIPQHADHLHWDNTGQWQKAGREKNGADSFGGGHAHEGCLIYQGGSWPAEFHNQLFTINFYGRRLNREELLPQGSGYLASHLPDLLHIGDPWFRGTDLLPASDGSVFLADWSDTGECHENDGVHRTSGRIYQISATKKSPPPPDLTPLSNLQLVALQQSPNQWLVRQSRLLLASRATIAPLEDARLALLKLFHSPNPNNPQLALHALWTLHAINAASTPLLLETLNHPHPHLRIWAIRLLTDDPSSLLSPPDAFLRLAATDPSPAVRLALASALQRFPATARPPLARPLLAHSEDALDHNLPLLLWYGLIPLGDSHPDPPAALLAPSPIPTPSPPIARPP
ncbi:MAG: dehydrogenase, partial [Verrucomicrobia bacterium]|nr:dehydrogenase [Verrucomicrobiota bacterium]